MSSYKGRVYLAPSGQWGFKFYIDDQEAGGGAGFESEKEAKLGCQDVLQSPSQRSRWSNTRTCLRCPDPPGQVRDRNTDANGPPSILEPLAPRLR